MSTITSIVSLGQACAAIQAMPDAVRRVADELGIEPVCRVNYIPHYDERDIERIAERLRRPIQPIQ